MGKIYVKTHPEPKLLKKMHYRNALGSQVTWDITNQLVGCCWTSRPFLLIPHQQCSIWSGPTRESNSALDAHRCMIVAHITSLMPDPRGIMGDKWCHCLSFWAVADCLSMSRTNLLSWDVIPPWVAVVLETGGEFGVKQVCLVLRGFRSMGLHQTDWEKWRSCFFRHTRGIWGLL